MKSMLGVGLWVMMVVAGCTSMQPTYYQLPIKTPVSRQASQKKTVVVEPVSLARAINTPRMVYQASATTVDYLHAHLWSPSLGDQITHYMVDALRQQSDTYWAVRLSSAVMKSTTRLRIHFERVDFDQQGRVTIQGEWQMSNQSYATPFKKQRSLAGKGYSLYVLRLSQLLDELANDVALTLGG